MCGPAVEQRFVRSGAGWGDRDVIFPIDVFDT